MRGNDKLTSGILSFFLASLWVLLCFLHWLSPKRGFDELEGFCTGIWDRKEDLKEERHG